MVDSTCKKFREDEDWNPNNFDIQINPNEIPSNIKWVNSSQLQYMLQRLMPLSKKVHFKYDTPSRDMSSGNNVFLSTKMKINDSEVKFI